MCVCVYTLYTSMYTNRTPGFVDNVGQGATLGKPGSKEGEKLP